MADVFLSYVRKDHPRAKQVADAPKATGYKVFYDAAIPPGSSWADSLPSGLKHEGQWITRGEKDILLRQGLGVTYTVTGQLQDAGRYDQDRLVASN